MEKPQNITFCPRCGGKGKLDWTNVENGVCFKCEGRGYTGIENDEFSSYMNFLQDQKRIAKSVSTKIDKLNLFLGRQFADIGTVRKLKKFSPNIDDIVLFSNIDFSKEYQFNVNPKFLLDFPEIHKFELVGLKSLSPVYYDQSNRSELNQQAINNGNSWMVDRWNKSYSIVGDHGCVVVNKISASKISVKFENINK